ncbi:MAG: VUT family protein [Proteobacteria bacterium]|nr:MAG: VUT family protein [Pseudomonadota bacterium]
MEIGKLQGIFYFVAFLLCIPVANWMVGNIGTQCVPDGPCLVPVLPSVMAPSGVLMIGLALVLRDLLQRRLGVSWVLSAIFLGAVLSALLAPGALVLASTAAFLLSELADFAIYTPLQKRRLLLAVFASSVVGLVIDSLVFLQLAFGNLDFLAGQVIGKAWMVVVAMPVIAWLRQYELRKGMQPA